VCVCVCVCIKYKCPLLIYFADIVELLDRISSLMTIQL